ncbi:MAG: response regulator [Rhodobacterales bacterium]
MKILVVDDDHLALSILRLYLADAGYYDVTVCEAPEAALALIENGDVEFGCFFFDIMMPFIHGIDLCKRVRNIQKYKETPIIMLTGISGKSDIDEAFSAGATDYVTKPFTMTEIGARVRIAENLVSIRNKSNPKSSILNTGQCHTGALPLSPILPNAGGNPPAN